MYLASTVTSLASKAITAINQRTQQSSSTATIAATEEQTHSTPSTILSSINKETLTDLGEKGKSLFSKAISWTRAKSTSLMEEVQKKTSQPSSDTAATNTPTPFGIAEMGKKMMKAWTGEEPTTHEEKVDQRVDQSLFTVDE